jgi:ribosomal protein S18 acetylase RimI-like enzyme
MFRRATLTDRPRIVALLADDPLGSTREETGLSLNPSYAAAFEAIDRDPNQLLTVMEIEGEIIGCFQLSFIPGLSRAGLWRGQIESLRIAAARRGAGLGRHMLEWAIAECRRRGYGLIQLATDKTRADALRFYKSLGFIPSHEGLKLILR